MLWLTVLGVVLAAVYCLATSPLYESSTRVLLIPKDATLPTNGVHGRLGYETPDTRELLATHMQIIASPRIVGRALEQHQLAALASLTEQAGEDPISYILNNLVVGRGGEGAAKDASVLTVGFRHSSPDDAARILSAIVDSYEQFVAATIRGAGDDAAELIHKAKTELESTVKAQEAEYREFRQSAPILWVEGQSQNSHQLRVQEMQAALASMRTRALAIRSRLTLVESALTEEAMAATTPEERFGLIDREEINRLDMLVQMARGNSVEYRAAQPLLTSMADAEYGKLVGLKLEASSARQRLGENHPSIVELHDQIKELEAYLDQQSSELAIGSNASGFSLDGLVRAYRKLLQVDLADLERQQQQLTELISKEETLAKSLINYELQEQAMVGSLDRSRELFEAVLGRLREINFLRDYGGFITEVLSPVELGRQVWPRIPLLLVAGLIAGGSAGLLISLVQEVFDRSFRDRSDVEQAMRAPVLAHLPRFEPSHEVLAKLQHISTNVVTLKNPNSRDTERIDALRQHLLSRSLADKAVLQITSSVRGEGTTTVAANLGVSLAQLGKRVLILDANLQAPAMHNLFGLKNNGGLGRALENGGSISHQSILAVDTVENLFVLPAGERRLDSAELNTFRNFKGLMDQLRNEFEIILVDGPPVLGVTESAVIGAACDATILVMKLTSEARRLSERTKELLRVRDEFVEGVVLNDSLTKTVESFENGERPVLRT